MTTPNQQPEVSAEAREAATTIFQEYISPGECAEIIQRAIDRATEKLREENLLFRDANNQLVIQRDQMEKLACEQSNQAHQLRAENEALRKDGERLDWLLTKARVSTPFVRNLSIMTEQRSGIDAAMSKGEAK